LPDGGGEDGGGGDGVDDDAVRDMTGAQAGSSGRPCERTQCMPRQTATQYGSLFDAA
jgi:hypothetical protein